MENISNNNPHWSYRDVNVCFSDSRPFLSDHHYYYYYHFVLRIYKYTIFSFSVVVTKLIPIFPKKSSMNIEYGYY